MTDPHKSTISAEAVQEELVAYLDGELDAAARARVEERLATDEAYRLQLVRLEQAWDLLDALPRTDADARFTHSTVEMVALAAQKEVREAKQTQRQTNWLGWAATLAMVALAGLLGYRVVNRIASGPNDALVRDLPVIEKVELYRHVDSVDFLRQLDQSGLFADEEAEDAI
jgi:anti-sigma factor RsiW